MKRHDQAPNGVFCEGMILYGFPERGAIAAKGFWITPPDIRGASVDRLHALQDQIRALLALMAPGRRLQLQWSCDSDYQRELTSYHAETERVTNPTVRQTRNERFTRYWRAMQNRTLRRERLALYLSIEISHYSGNVKTGKGLQHHYAAILSELQAQFRDFAQSLRTLFHDETCVTPMGDDDHTQHLRSFLNPSIVNRGNQPKNCDPTLTIQEQCWLSEGVGQPDGGFYLDGHFHAVVTLDRWPQRTRPGIVTHLTGLPFLDYCITVNVVPTAARSEIHREEKAIERLSGEYADQGRHSLAVALRKKTQKVGNLAGGFVRPFEVAYVIRVWAPTQEGLREKVAAVQAAIHAMDGAQYLECAVPTTAKKLFFATWPGWTHSSYEYRHRYAEDTYLADLLPFSATFVGQLTNAEAIYDGSHQNLVGVSTSLENSPQHAVVLGMTGTGKSAALHDLLMQTAGYYDYSVIIEEGLSYARFSEALGESPIIIHPDAPLTINYLDTQGLPVTQLHLASAVALLTRMVGAPDTAGQLALRSAQLTSYVHQLFMDAHIDWSRRHPQLAEDARRLACAVYGWKQRGSVGTTLLEAFVDYRDRRGKEDDEVLEFTAKLSEAEITKFAQTPATAPLVARFACTFFQPEDYPTHGALVDLLSYARLPEHPKAEIDQLATLLRAWSKEGTYGQLFDGVTTVSLDRSVAHFELGYVPEQAVELKAAIGLLVSGFARQHILALPRAKRKRIIFEEVARFLDVPGGEKIVGESYAQLRKFNCWAVSIVQQYARFKTSRVRSAVMGNAKQFFVMRQSDRSDLVDLSQDLGLPESALDVIQRYPLPEQLPADQRHSALCYFAPTVQPPLCGTLRHYEPKIDHESSDPSKSLVA
jgi:type IV secretion system protein TrbE